MLGRTLWRLELRTLLLLLLLLLECEGVQCSGVHHAHRWRLQACCHAAPQDVGLLSLYLLLWLLWLMLLLLLLLLELKDLLLE